MKKIIIVVAALLIILVMGGCAQDIVITKENNTKRSDVFDQDMTHKPTNAETLLITTGMRMSEIIEIIGKPHRMGPTSGVITVQWTTVEGDTFGFTIYDIDKEAPEDVDLYDILRTYGIAKIYSPHESADTQK